MTLMTEKQPSLTSLQPVLCCYVNNTGKIQVSRISNIENWYFERVVFPGERLLFEALPQAELEIHQCTLNGNIISDRILCQNLQVYEDAHETESSV